MSSDEAVAAVVLAGVAFSALTLEEVLDKVFEGMSQGRGGRIVTPNIDILRQAVQERSMLELVNSADIVVCDGMPIIWASRLRRSPLPERVAGSALGPELARRAASDGTAIFLLGGSEGVAREAAERLGRQYPGLRVGYHYPPRGYASDPAQMRRIEEAIEAFGPAVCLVGLGFPKQDQLAERLLAMYPANWYLGAGATVGFLAGEFRRAPKWMQRFGLEWMFRLLQEPGRLWKRYLMQDAPFAVRLIVASLLVRYGDGLWKRSR